MSTGRGSMDLKGLEWTYPGFKQNYRNTKRSGLIQTAEGLKLAVHWIENDRNTYYPSPFTRARESITLRCIFSCVQHTPAWPLSWARNVNPSGLRPLSNLKRRKQQTTTLNNSNQSFILLAAMFQSSFTILREEISSEIIKR